MNEELAKLAYSKLETDATFEEFKSDVSADEGLQELVYSKLETDATFEEFKADLFGASGPAPMAGAGSETDLTGDPMSTGKSRFDALGEALTPKKKEESTSEPLDETGEPVSGSTATEAEVVEPVVEGKTPVEPEKPTGINYEQKRKKKREELLKSANFNMELGKIDKTMIDLDEEVAVPQLEEMYGKYGFKFSETGLGDAVKVRAFDGEEMVIDLQPFTTYGTAGEIKKFKDFVSKQAVPEDIVESAKAELKERQSAKNKEEAEMAELKTKNREELIETDTFKNDLDKVNPESLDLEETKAVEEFSRTYGKYGFSFREVGIGDAMEVMAPNTKTMTVDLQSFTSMGSKYETEALRKFLTENAEPPKEESAVDKEANKFFRERGIEYSGYKESYDKYTDIKDRISFLDDAPKSLKDLTPAQRKKYGEYYVNGQLVQDAADIQDELEDERDDVTSFINDPKFREVREDFDTYIDKKVQKSIEESVTSAGEAKGIVDEIAKYSEQYFGVTPDKLHTVKPKDKEELEIYTQLQEAYLDAKESAKLSAQKYELASTYMGAKFDESLSGEMIEGLNAVKHEWDNGMANGKAMETILWTSMGISGKNTKELAEQFVDQMSKVDNTKQGRATYRFSEAQGYREVWDVFKERPMELAQGLMAQSLSQIIPYGKKIVPAAVGLGIAGGATYGAMGANPLTVAGGALVGAGWGLRGGMAATSVAMEYTNAVVDAMRNNGYDVTDPEQVELALKDKKVWDEGRDIGLKRGLTIGAVDMLTSGLAGRVFKVGTTANKLKRAGAFVAERAAFDPVAESFGEATAMLVAGQKLDEKEIIAEGLGAFGNNSSTGLVNAAIDARRNTVQKRFNRLKTANGLANESTSSEKLVNWVTKLEKLGKVTRDEAAEVKTKIGLRDEATDLLETSGKKKKTKAVSRLMDLIEARDNLTETPNRQEVFKEEVAAIKEEIQELAKTGKVRPAEQQASLVKKETQVVEAETPVEPVAETDTGTSTTTDTGTTTEATTETGTDTTTETDTDTDQEVADLEATLESEEKKTPTQQAEEKSLFDGKPDKVDPALEEKQQQRKLLDNEAKKATKSLSKQGTKVVVLNSTAEFKEATGKVGANKGNGVTGRGYYNEGSNTIFVNAEKANRRTVAHESIHAVLVQAFNKDNKRIKAVVDKVHGALQSANIDPEAKKHINEFLQNYKKQGKTKFLTEEFLAELGGLIAETGTEISVDQTVKDKVIAAIAELLKTMGFNVDPKEFGTTEAVSLLNGLATAIAEGKSTEEATAKLQAIEAEAEAKKAAEAKKKREMAKAEREKKAAEEAKKKEAERKERAKAKALKKEQATRIKEAKQRAAQKKKMQQEQAKKASENAKKKEAKAVEKQNKRAEAIAKKQLRKQEMQVLMDEAKQKAISVGEFINNTAASIKAGTVYASKEAVKIVKKLMKSLLRGAVIAGVLFNATTMSYNNSQANFSAIEYITDSGTLNVDYIAATHKKMYPNQASIILDKQNRQIYIYDANGNVIHEGGAIIGAYKGDTLPTKTLKSIEYSQEAYAKAKVGITPSGVFEAIKTTKEAYGTDVLWKLPETRIQKDDGTTGVHAFHANLKSREFLLNDNNTGNNAASMGCFGINLADFNDVAPQLTDNVQVYIVPETDNREVFSDYLNQRVKGSTESFADYLTSNQREQLDDESDSTMVYVAPFYDTQVASQEDAKKLRNSDAYLVGIQAIKDTADALGLEYDVIQGGIGGFVNEQGTEIMEVTNIIRFAPDQPMDKVIQFTALMGANTAEVQEATIANKYVDENSEGYQGDSGIDELTISVDKYSMDEVLDSLKESGVKEFSINAAEGTITILDFSKGTDTAAIDSINKLSDTLNKKGISHEAAAKRAVEGNYIGPAERRGILQQLFQNAIQKDRLGKSSSHRSSKR